MITRAANQGVVEAPLAILHIGEILPTDLLLQGMKHDLLASKRVRLDI